MHKVWIMEHEHEEDRELEMLRSQYLVVSGLLAEALIWLRKPARIPAENYADFLDRAKPYISIKEKTFDA